MEIAMGGSVEDCEAATAACLAEPSEDTCDMAVEDVAECDATLGELEACLNDMVAHFTDLSGKIACDTPMEDLPTEEDMSATPPACEVIDEKCPGFFDEEVEVEDDSLVDMGPDEEPLSSLDWEEVAAICENLQDSLGGMLDESLCTMESLMLVWLDGASVEECEAAYDDCVEGSIEPICEFQSADFADCDVLIGEMEDCVEAQFWQLAEVGGQLSCEVTAEDAMAIMQAAEELPDECLPIQDECPELFDSDL